MVVVVIFIDVSTPLSHSSSQGSKSDSIEVEFRVLGDGWSKVTLRDLWAHKDMGTFENRSE